MSEPRTFNKRQRRALLANAGGLCEICGSKLGADWEAHHKVPYSKGGRTVISNGAATCRSCNRKEGDRLMIVTVKAPTPRAWQKQLVRLVSENRAMTVVSTTACPGAGKTIACLLVATRRMQELNNPALVIVAPSCEVRDNWATVALRSFGLNIIYPRQVKVGGKKKSLQWDGTGECLGTSATYQGTAFTFAAIAYKPNEEGSWASRLRDLVDSRDTVLIVDEVHHASANESWGRELNAALSGAALSILATGTPFRTDRQRIEFAKYTPGGEFIADVTYSYGDAIRDSVCRPVTFHRVGGRQEWLNPGGTKDSADFTEPANKASEARRLLTALDTRSDLVHVMIREANDKLTMLRESIPDAGGLLVAVDQDHARMLCGYVQDVSGERPALAISDGDKDGEDGGAGSEVIKKFRTSRARWIVAVGMVSEGVDIQRLKVLVYATNVTSELRFRQIVGRVVRTRELEPHGSSHAWIPNDSRLVAHAEEIEDEIRRGLQERAEDLKKKIEDGGNGSTSSPGFIPLGGEGECRGVIDRGDAFSAEDIRKADFIRTEAGLDKFSFVDVARVIKMCEVYETRGTTAVEAIDAGEAIARAQHNVNQLVKQYGYTMFGKEDKKESIRQAWNAFRREFGSFIKPSEVSDAKKLDRMEKVAERMLERAKRVRGG